MVDKEFRKGPEVVFEKTGALVVLLESPDDVVFPNRPLDVEFTTTQLLSVVELEMTVVDWVSRSVLEADVTVASLDAAVLELRYNVAVELK